MTFSIPFSGRAHTYTEDEIQSVVDVMRSTENLTQGRHLAAFESAFKSYAGCEHAFAVMNATAALEMSAQFLQLEPEDEVIIPSHTFTSSAYPYAKRGAKVVWADIDSDTRVVTADTLAPLISDKTKAVVVVHLYGYCADMRAIASLCREKGVMLIEDTAQALGARLDGQCAGTFGDFGVFSFHSHKNLTTLGEGGMLVVKDPEIAALIPQVRHNGHCAFEGERPQYWKPAMGDLKMPHYKGKPLWPNNYCIGEAECAVGTLLLNRADDMNNQKRRRAMRFIDALAEFDIIKFHREDSERHVYHLLTAEVKSSLRDSFIETLSGTFGVQGIVQYYPLNRYPLYESVGLAKADCPTADQFFDNMVSFPFQHWMSNDDFEAMLKHTRATLECLKKNH